MGLSYGVGRAWAEMAEGSRVFVVLGDGELGEGSVWEAAALAGHLELPNLIAIVDANGLQSEGKCEDILRMDLDGTWSSFGWRVVSCEGNSTDAVFGALKEAESGGPVVIIAHTVKGQGVSFMEGNNDWHHRELKQQEYDAAIVEVGERYGLQ